MVFAIDISQEGNFKPAKIVNVSTLLNVILPLLTFGAAMVFLAICLYAAFMWITNGENKEKIAEAHKTFGYAVFGLFVVIASFIIVKLIGFVLGVTNILPL
ncbi:hypothetical protein HY041_01050 [Candidatus Roizmanbacteria bacterium]|nr:hypothetical protein [Candidatus Roizmanbacteria bacterium]